METFIVKLVRAAALSQIEKTGRSDAPTLQELLATFFAHEILDALGV